MSTSSKSRSKSYTYYIYLTSWVSSNTFSQKVSGREYNTIKSGDVFEAITKEGYFGYQYYATLSKTNDKTLFPQGTKFPLTEEEFQKICEEVKQAELEKEYKKNKHPYYR